MEKFCKKCGNKLSSECKFCTRCGESTQENITSTTNINSNVQNDYMNSHNGTSPTAIASLVCSLVGLFLWGVILGIVGICLGLSAKNHIKIFKNEKGEGLATAGIIIGIVDIVFAIIGSITLLSLL